MTTLLSAGHSAGAVGSSAGGAVTPPPRLGSDGVAHFHFVRLWPGRHYDGVYVFANGHVYDRAERRRSLRQLVGMIRRERERG